MKRKSMSIIGIIAAAVIVGGGLIAYAKYFGPQTVMQTNTDSNCRQGNIMDGVDRQARFTVLSTCEKAIGVVHDMTSAKQDDGDYQFNIDVQPEYKHLLNNENNKQVNGMLVIEIIPKDQLISGITIPKNNDTIQVYGAWVTDNPHGWNEIHPAWSVKVLS